MLLEVVLLLRLMDILGLGYVTGVSMVSSPLSISDALTLYLSSRLCLSQETADQYGYAIRPLTETCPVIADLSADVVIAHLRTRLKQVSAKSVKRERGTILTLWRWAYRNGHNKHNPFEADIPAIKVPKRAVVAWTPDEFERLVVTAKQLPGDIRGTGIPKAAWWSSLLITMYWIGSRIGATLAVRTTDIDFRRRLIYLREDEAKTGIGQWLGLHDQATAAVMTHYSANRELVWPWPYSPRLKFDHLKKLLRKADLPADRYHAFHCVRRTTATLACKYGGIAVAQQTLGHTSQQQTAGYLDQSQLGATQAADVLPTLNI